MQYIYRYKGFSGQQICPLPMPKLIIVITLLFAVLTAWSQQPSLQWAKAFDPYVNADYSNGRTVGVDGQGNVYSAGLFTNTVDFDPGPGVYALTADNIYATSIYISKLDANGNFVWAGQIPTLVEFGEIELKVDKAGNVYLASDLRNETDMDPGPGVFMMTPSGFRDAFVVKLNTNGNLVWAKQFGGPDPQTGPQTSGIELDKNNDVIIAGTFNNTIDLDPGPGVLNTIPSPLFQSFIVKLDNDGDLIWGKQFGNGSEVYSGCNVSDIKSDNQGNIVLIGSFGRTVDFDPGPGEQVITSSPGSTDGFICKLDGNCNFIWVKTLQERNGDNNYSITPKGVDIDGMNNILITGWFIGNYDFDPGAGSQTFFSNPYDCFILKLNAQGNYVWVKVLGGDESESGNDIVVDAANNVYVLGSFGSSMDYDPGPGTFFINSPYEEPSVLVKFSSEGNFIYAAPFIGMEYATDIFRRMAIDPALNIYITGAFDAVIDFDPGPNVFPLAGSSSPFVLKLGICSNATSATLNINACNNYTINNQTYDSSGTYLQTLINASGCDSLITINLSLGKKKSEQSKTICDGGFFFAGGKNQTQPGIYTDTLKTELGCDSVITTFLIVNPKPSLNLGPDKSICKNTTLSITPGAGFINYVWQDQSGAASLTVSTTGVYWVTVTNNFNCEATDSIEIISLINPPSNFLVNKDSVCGYKSLDLIPSGSYNNYQWSTGQSSKSIQVQNAGTYWLSVTDANGCEGKDTVTIFAKQCMFGVYIPSAFTPDNNGKNDNFKALVYGKLLQFKMVVYSRWGNVVFQSNDPQKGWNGTIGGQVQNTGVFIWVCSYQLEGADPKTENGTVTLIR
jgi:gliding motility-associated-like protein